MITFQNNKFESFSLNENVLEPVSLISNNLNNIAESTLSISSIESLSIKNNENDLFLNNINQNLFMQNLSNINNSISSDLNLSNINNSISSDLNLSNINIEDNIASHITSSNITIENPEYISTALTVDLLNTIND